jgi:hypothetical protein
MMLTSRSDSRAEGWLALVRERRDEAGADGDLEQKLGQVDVGEHRVDPCAQRLQAGGLIERASFSRSILFWATSKIGWSRRSPSSVREYAASSSSLSMLTNASGLSGSLSEVRVSARDTVHARSESSTELGSPQRSERPTNTSPRVQSVAQRLQRAETCMRVG